MLPISDPLMLTIAAAFKAGGHELFLVGGAVRDRLLGTLEQRGELDFTTDARPEETADILASLALGNPYRIGEKFGTIGLSTGGRTVEITTYRSKEVYVPGSRHPEITFGATLSEDLQRRDFTINALAVDPCGEEIIDPFGGVRDLRAGVLRAVGTPEERFSEDPLRLLRGVRFAARFQFTIEPSTWTAMQHSHVQLETISRERVRDEYSRMLLGEDAPRALTLLRDSGMLATSVPLLQQLTLMPDHGPRHPLSLWDHTMRVVASVPARLEVRWAALLHDIAKPHTRAFEPSGRIRFFGHEEAGAEMAGTALRTLRYPTSVIEGVSLLVQTHMQLHAYSPDWTDGAVRRLALRLDGHLEDALALAAADARGHSIDVNAAPPARYALLAARLAELEREPSRSLVSPLSGDDLMGRYDRPPGPWIGVIKDALRDEVLEGRLRPGDREAAWDLADTLITAADSR